MPDNKKRIFSILSSVIILSLCIEILVSFYIANTKRENRKQEAYIYGQSVVTAIQLTMDNIVNASESLKYFYLQFGDASIEYFDRIAAPIMEDNPIIASIYIAPGGVLQAAYPDEVKESTIGFNILADPEQGPKGQLAIATKKVTVAGPHNLVEGGRSFIIRNPVYQEGEFIGFTIIVLDWDKFVDVMLANTKADAGTYNFAVWKDASDGTAVLDDNGYIFRNDKDATGRISTDVDIAFEVPNDTWHLNIEPVNGWLTLEDMESNIIISLTVTIIATLLTFFSLSSLESKKLLQLKETEDKAKSEYMTQLSEALERAKKADAAKTSFLSKMSHDIRTPLNGIIGLIEISDRHPDDPKLLAENRAKEKVAANHLLSLISDVLELSKIDDENVQLIKEPFNIYELTKDVSSITDMQALEAGITITHNEHRNVFVKPYVIGSALHVRQILLNIFSNAIKYNKPNGTITSTTIVVEQTETTITYRTTIEDTGIGMSPEFMEHMFEPFSQEHSDARSVYQGTGLGMAIVKNLVEKMNGSLEVSSVLGEGTKFTITVPFEIADEEDISSSTEVKEESIVGMKILLVEDNELNMEIATAILSDSGAIITTAVNGQEAFEKFSNNPPNTFDVILMDLMMPVMDGFAATDAIRNYEREDSKDIPIIAMTANAFAEDAQKCKEAGMNGHISKPINIPVLLSEISKHRK